MSTSGSRGRCETHRRSCRQQVTPATTRHPRNRVRGMEIAPPRLPRCPFVVISTQSERRASYWQWGDRELTTSGGDDAEGEGRFFEPEQRGVRRGERDARGRVPQRRRLSLPGGAGGRVAVAADRRVQGAFPEHAHQAELPLPQARAAPEEPPRLSAPRRRALLALPRAGADPSASASRAAPASFPPSPYPDDPTRTACARAP